MYGFSREWRSQGTFDVREDMSSQIMRLLVFFDLPVLTAKNRHDYSQFRKFLIKEGYLQMQESVYSKIVLSQTTEELERAKLEKKLPPKGLVQLLVVTEKQYASIQFLVGSKEHDEIDSTSRLVIL
jgi:CRISPR-associated protein Cas2